MKVYATEAIRNLAVIGHGDAGKTQLISSLLYVAGATPRWGKVDEGTTVTDHDEDSIARKITLNTAIAHAEHRETKINFIDTPGYAAFVSHARPAVRVADCGVVVVVHMKAYSFDENGKAKEIDIPTEGRDVVDKTRERLVELVAESDDALMEKYFEQGTLDDSDVLPNIGRAIANSKLSPVFAVSTTTLVGISVLLDHIIEFAPNPAAHEAEHGKNERGDPESRKYSSSEPFSAYCFR